MKYFSFHKKQCFKPETNVEEEYIKKLEKEPIPHRVFHLLNYLIEDRAALSK